MDSNTTKTACQTTALESKNGEFIALAFVAGFLYRLILSKLEIRSLDIDFSDDLYTNIFSNPDAVTIYFNYYLTGLIGGTWYNLFGAQGLFGFGMLETITQTLAVFFVYKAFRRYLYGKWTAPVAVFMSFLFPAFVVTFHYNTLTFFFIAFAAWCYSKSLHGHRLCYTWLTGFALGLCFFVRIVNVSLSALVLVPLVYLTVTHQRRQALRTALTMIAGMLCGCLLVLALMAVNDHLTYFLQAIRQAYAYFSNGETSQAAPGSPLLIYLKGYVNIILQILAIVGLTALYIQSSRLSSYGGMALRGFLVLASLVLIATSQPYLTALALYSLLCLPMLYAVTPKEDKLLTSFLLLATYILPIGSDLDIAGIFHWMAALLILPAAAGTYHTSRILQRGALICSLYIAVVMLYRAFTMA